MYIDPFWAGVACTIAVELVLLVGCALISTIKKN